MKPLGCHTSNQTDATLLGTAQFEAKAILQDPCGISSQCQIISYRFNPKGDIVAQIELEAYFQHNKTTRDQHKLTNGLNKMLTQSTTHVLHEAMGKLESNVNEELDTQKDVNGLKKDSHETMEVVSNDGADEQSTITDTILPNFDILRSSDRKPKAIVYNDWLWNHESSELEWRMAPDYSAQDKSESESLARVDTVEQEIIHTEFPVRPHSTSISEAQSTTIQICVECATGLPLIENLVRLSTLISFYCIYLFTTSLLLFCFVLDLYF